MIKLAGAILVLLATAAAGIGAVAKLRARVRFLSAVITSLEMMKNEICSRLTPMEDVFESLSETAPEPARELFSETCRRMGNIGEEPFSAIWRGAVDKTCGDVLTAEERGALSETGLSLGRYDAEWQGAAIDRAAGRFEKFREGAEAVRDRDSKMHAFLGVAAGVFAVIVLI